MDLRQVNTKWQRGCWSQIGLSGMHLWHQILHHWQGKLVTLMQFTMKVSN